ncbi:presqualene diphosphate synthase HpnD [Acuticoccus sp. M5D2P5]|uniref:presqualene diphosphate synthase HpnD n=1 Tax=Acuticoccus kalidii TaxID=2910977 RepID=UPI001F30E0DD|nr:presqualene diphosphate synthase HpnD [Acuticoccus kalidii]MCF3935830.1 presqualene diphosphate synthase HpnD [Acuticoccus kalidii]
MAAEAATVERPGTGTPTVAPAPKKSSFYLAMRLLPPDERRAMYAIYAFCRAVDDIADCDRPRAGRHADLDAWRGAIEALYAGRVPPGLEPIGDAIGRFDLRRTDFDAIIDGMAMDVDADIVTPDRATLDLYIDRVASAPGRLSVRVFGLSEAAGIDLSRHLGSALQLTNILRDLDEDAERGRLYLPQESLRAAGITDMRIEAVLAAPQLTAACTSLAHDAAHHFDEAARIMDAAPRRAVRAPRLMAAAYRPMLVKMVAAGWQPPRTRVSKSKAALALAMLRYAFI